MSKALFAVYQDPTTSTSSRSTKRKLHPEGGTGWNGKENFDPFAKTDLNVFKDGMDKIARGKAVSGKGEVKGKSTTTKPHPTSSSKLGTVTSSSAPNDVCTGSLRTRVIPMPNIFTSSSTSLGKPQPVVLKLGNGATLRPMKRPVPRAAAAMAPVRAPSAKLDLTKILDMEVDDKTLFSEDSLAIPGATRSASGSPMSIRSGRDSGYGMSDASEPEVDLVMGGLGMRDRDEDDSDEEEEEGETLEDSTIKLSEEDDDFESNRKARALTESPLAEVTQAFTGLGSFSFSPSPSPISTTFNTTSHRTQTSPNHSPSKSARTRSGPKVQVPYVAPSSAVAKDSQAKTRTPGTASGSGVSVRKPLGSKVVKSLRM
ncbi:hypothetical protein T439DRAFT_328948 [Meredithblackwellia eburnea MCA 4105]